MKILVTSGATREYLDGVRYLSNISTGKTGSLLADELMARGHEIVFLHGEDSRIPARPCRSHLFTGASDLEQSLMRILRNERFDAVVHLAAVSDYSVVEAQLDGHTASATKHAKMTSDAEIVTLTLRRNSKILPQIKSFAAMGEPIVVGFKLTVTDDKAQWVQAVNKVYESRAVDWVVHNDLSDMRADQHAFRIIAREGKVDGCHNVHELALKLDQIFEVSR